MNPLAVTSFVGDHNDQAVITHVYMYMYGQTALNYCTVHILYVALRKFALYTNRGMRKPQLCKYVSETKIGS